MMKKFKNQISRFAGASARRANIKIVNISLQYFSHFNFYIVILIFTLYILILYYHPAFAQTACQPQSPNPRAEGLISVGTGIGTDISSKFSNTAGTCVNDLKAKFNDIPNYKTLKSIYYEQSKAPTIKSPIDNSTTISAVANNTVYNFANLSGVGVGSSGPLNYPATTTAVIFVDNNLSITDNIIGPTPIGTGGGLVFVVGGDIYIAPSVFKIDAVLIAEGNIYTAGNSGTGCATNAVNVGVNALTVNGSLISLNSSKPIMFCRTLGAANSSTPAEKINQQPKYLVILKDLFAETWQKWSEIQ